MKERLDILEWQARSYELVLMVPLKKEGALEANCARLWRLISKGKTAASGAWIEAREGRRGGMRGETCAVNSSIDHLGPLTHDLYD